MLVVVLGPQTRLAKSLLNSSWARETTFVLVARNIREYEAITLAQPRAAVYRAWEFESPLPEEHEAAAVVCCAFGVIHPGSVVPARDLERVRADCRTLDAVVRKYAHLPMHLVFVSSALALCPRQGREYYAGCKNVGEAVVRRVAEGNNVARLSVFYPGRLVEKREIARPVSLLYTSYQGLAEAIVSGLGQNRSQKRIVGLDARLWLTLRAFRLVWSTLTGRR